MTDANGPAAATTTVLITGASGYLGQHLLTALAADKQLVLHAAYGSLDTFEDDFGAITTCHSVDLGSEEASAALVSTVKPDVLVHLAAMSSPAACEKDPEATMRINCPKALFAALPEHASIILLSTDQVYDGLRPVYKEDSVAEPVNIYGRSKLACERAVRELAPSRSVCLRSSLILGPSTPGRCRKQSFLQFCNGQFAAQSPTNFFSDEVRSAVYVGDIVRIIQWFVRGGAKAAPGTYNMGGPERLTRVQMATAVVAHGGYQSEGLVCPVARASLPPSGVASPPDISMDSSELVRVTGVKLTQLQQMVKASL